MYTSIILVWLCDGVKVYLVNLIGSESPWKHTSRYASEGISRKVQLKRDDPLKVGNAAPRTGVLDWINGGD